MRQVTPKPLSRSLTFWSGILVMIFICWAWRDSESNVSSVGDDSWSIYHHRSAVAIWRDPLRSPTAIKFRRDRGDESIRAELFPAPLSMWGDDKVPSPEEWKQYFGSRQTARENIIWTLNQNGPQGSVLYLPHWLLLLACALPWSGLLLWRTRRMRGDEKRTA